MSSTFKGVLTSAHKGELIIPGLQSYLFDPKFEDFNVKTKGFETREPDGWFHPSTHPLWPERMLFYYLTAPKQLVVERFDPMSTLAVTQGQFWHGFIGRCVVEAGIVNELEVFVKDDDTMSRGHMDGVGGWGVFEMKTMMSMKARKITDLDTFRDKCPDYYAQAQEYMRLSGFREHRTLIIGTEYPFEMKEIVMPYDRAFANEIRDKYLRVLQDVADQRPARPCCGPGSKESKVCPARSVCPIGLAA